MAPVGHVDLVKLACVQVPHFRILWPLFMHVYGASPAPTPNRRVRRHSLIIQLVRHHQLCQIVPKFQRWHCRFLPRTGPCLSRIHLCNRAKKSKLSIWPPFCLPNLLQPNFGAGVKESGHGGAAGADASGDLSHRHRRMREVKSA